MFVESLLSDPNNSHLIFISGKSAEIVIGVPHHTPLGVVQLPCKEHPDADENTGFLGYYISQLLNCSCAIACNYFLDPNKNSETDYCKKLLLAKPKVLVEIHGHGSSSAKFDIEISSGSLEYTFWSKEMAERLQKVMSNTPILCDYTLSGDFNAIYFKATKTFTITTDKWVAFHIELPKRLRQSKSHYVLFCEILARTIAEILKDFDEIVEAQAKKPI